jgi:hypothetical protein
MEKQIYQDEDYKATYDKVIKAFTELQPLRERIKTFKAINVSANKSKLNESFMEMLKYLTTTSRRYLLDEKYNVDKENPDRKVEICVNENGLGYISDYSSHATNLCGNDGEYYFERLKRLLSDKDAVLGISNLIKKDNRIEFLKVVDDFNNSYSEIDKALIDEADEYKMIGVKINITDELILKFNRSNTLDYIYIDGITEDKTHYSLNSDRALNRLMTNYDEEDFNFKGIVGDTNLTDLIILNCLVKYQNEFINDLDSMKIKGNELLLMIEKYKQKIDDKLKPIKAYEKL